MNIPTKDTKILKSTIGPVFSLSEQECVCALVRAGAGREGLSWITAVTAAIRYILTRSPGDPKPTIPTSASCNTFSLARMLSALISLSLHYFPLELQADGWGALQVPAPPLEPSSQAALHQGLRLQFCSRAVAVFTLNWSPSPK